MDTNRYIHTIYLILIFGAGMLLAAAVDRWLPRLEIVLLAAAALFFMVFALLPKRYLYSRLVGSLDTFPRTFYDVLLVLFIALTAVLAAVTLAKFLTHMWNYL